MTFLSALFMASAVEGQNLLDSVTLAQQPFYHTLNEALLHPDSVFKLDLSKKHLKELPTGLQQLPHLQVLRLSRNSLHEIPAWIDTLKNLQSLDISNNDLKELPPSIGNLSQLVFLGLNRNVIETLPHEIGQLSLLEVLEMWDNELQYVPDEMKNLHNLKVFELRGILFSDEAQQQINDLLPDTDIYFSPSCQCKN